MKMDQSDPAAASGMLGMFDEVNVSLCQCRILVAMEARIKPDFSRFLLDAGHLGHYPPHWRASISVDHQMPLSTLAAGVSDRPSIGPKR